MSQYILRRVLSMVPVLLIFSVIAFALLYVLPGDPAVAILGTAPEINKRSAENGTIWRPAVDARLAASAPSLCDGAL